MLSRRKFLGLTGGCAAALLGILFGRDIINFGQCVLKPKPEPPIQDVSIYELRLNPKGYLNQEIRTSGYAEFVGLELYSIPQDAIKPSFIEAEIPTYKLYESKLGGNWIKVADVSGSGPIFTPGIPIVRPSSGSIYEDHLSVFGLWTHDGQNGNRYYLKTYYGRKITES